MDDIDKLQSELNRLKREKIYKKSDYSKKIVSSIIILNVIFTVIVIYCFLKIGSEPVALIGAFFSFTTVELWQLARIKKSKIDKGV